MDYFARLGAALEAAWTQHDRLEERFGDVAMLALSAMPPADAFDRTALLDHLLDPIRPTPMQLAPGTAFGQPGFTVHYGRGFVIEVYHWLDSISAIHNHPFCGVFTILSGFSVHARYDVGQRSPLGGRAYRAPLRLRDLSVLDEGAVVPFSLHRHPLVHALIHVPRSAISMVIRTVRTEGYFRYLPPSLALPMEDEGEPLNRQLALLDTLRQAGDPTVDDRIDRMLEHADFELALRLLSSQWSDLSAPRRNELLTRLRARLGDAIDLMAPAIERASQLADATTIRQAHADESLRLVAIALGYAERREQVLNVLAARSSDPIALLHHFVDEAGLFDVGEEASAVIAHALVDGGGTKGALAAVEQQYGPEARREHEAEIIDFCDTSVFAALRD